MFERKFVIPIYEFIKTLGRINFKIVYLLRVFLYILFSAFLMLLLAFKPLFLSCLCVPEARSVAISYLTTCIGLS